jgi:hypothetical protein
VNTAEPRKEIVIKKLWETKNEINCPVRFQILFALDFSDDFKQPKNVKGFFGGKSPSICSCVYGTQKVHKTLSEAIANIESEKQETLQDIAKNHKLKWRIEKGYFKGIKSVQIWMIDDYAPLPTIYGQYEFINYKPTDKIKFIVSTCLLYSYFLIK